MAYLTQVYLSAIEGFVPDDVVRALRAFIEFCYLARRDIHDADSIARMDAALAELVTVISKKSKNLLGAPPLNNRR